MFKMHLTSITLILAVQFLLHNAAKIEQQSRIYMGKTAKPNSAAYQAALWLTNQQGVQSLCGGSLITTKFVLTAAHCFHSIESILVVLGANSLDGSEVTTVSMFAEQFKGHEKYDVKTVDNDIGVVELSNPVKLNKFIALVKLPKKSNDKLSYDGKYGKLTGWGVTTDNKPVASSVLKQLRVRLVGEHECRGFQISSLHLCGYGVNSGSACVGDSGGPLILEGTSTQIGIVSFGSSDGCTVGNAHVYTNVGPYLEWIQQNTDYNIVK